MAQQIWQKITLATKLLVIWKCAQLQIAQWWYIDSDGLFECVSHPFLGDSKLVSSCAASLFVFIVAVKTLSSCAFAMKSMVFKINKHACKQICPIKRNIQSSTIFIENRSIRRKHNDLFGFCDDDDDDFLRADYTIWNSNWFLATIECEMCTQYKEIHVFVHTRTFQL